MLGRSSARSTASAAPVAGSSSASAKRLSTWVVIPARWASSRLPGKPLADVGGIPMVERVRRSCQVPGVDRIVVATDDDRIADVVVASGGEAIMTGPAPTGTHRVWNAVRDLDGSPELIINVQGDLPFLPPLAIQAVVTLLRSGARVATVATPWPPDVPIENPAVVKVEINTEGTATRFTRAAIDSAWRHVGIYGFRREALRQAIAADRAPNASEDLEQLAWMEVGLPIDVAVIADAGPSVDTPEQLENARRFLMDPMYPSADPQVTSALEVPE